MKHKFRLQLIEESDLGEITVLSEGIAELGALKLKKDFGIDPFQMMAEAALKEAKNKNLYNENDTNPI